MVVGVGVGVDVAILLRRGKFNPFVGAAVAAVVGAAVGAGVKVTVGEAFALSVAVAVDVNVAVGVILVFAELLSTKEGLLNNFTPKNKKLCQQV